MLGGRIEFGAVRILHAGDLGADLWQVGLAVGVVDRGEECNFGEVFTTDDGVIVYNGAGVVVSQAALLTVQGAS